MVVMEWLAAHWAGIADWIIRTFFVGGVGWSGWRYIKERRARAAKAHIEESKSEVEERTVDNKVISSSITTLEASRVSMLAGWESERASLRGTVEFQAAQLAESRAREIEKDRLIGELRGQVDELREAVRKQAAELNYIADRLSELQSSDEGTK